MAWISVHEQILSGKLRELAKSMGCSQNESIGILIRLWLWGINNADKEGRIVEADKDDVAEVLAIGRDKKIAAINIVDALIESGWMDENDGILFIHDWEEWQEPLYTFKERRERDAARKREERKRSRFQTEAYSQPIIQELELEPESASAVVTPKEPEKAKRAPAERTPAFDEFWKIYPRKEGKGEAYKKYKARLNDGYTEAVLLEAATNYASRCARERTEKKYIKMAKTFLSDSLPFLDYVKEQSHEGTKHEQDGVNPFGQFLKS